MSSQAPLLQVAAKAAIVDNKGRVLILREAESGTNNTKVGLYGLVGGRLEPGESFAEGLKREVFEETGMAVSPKSPLYVGEWRPVIHGIEHQIIAIFMLCEPEGSEVRLSVEHDKYAWVDPEDRKKFPMMEPDCFVVDKLIGSTIN